MRFYIPFIVALVLLAVANGRAQDRMQGRSVVMSRGGIVAAESPLAAQAGAAILAHGGNAVDAAVAANAAMGVVAPMMNGMGGDLFAIVYDAKTGKLYGLNASGWAPAGLTIEFLKSRGIAAMPGHGIQTVTVPGVVDGWSKLLEKFGRKKFPEVLAAAIHYANDGYPVSERTAVDWDRIQFYNSRRCECREDVFARRPRSSGWRNFPESRPGQRAAENRWRRP